MVTVRKIQSPLTFGASIPVEQVAQIRALAQVRKLLPGADQKFSGELVGKGQKWLLSEKQMYWVDKFIRRALFNPPVAEGSPLKKQVEGLSVPEVWALFSDKKKGTALHLPMAHTQHGALVLVKKPDTSKSPGVSLKAGKDFDSPWFGTIAPGGEVEWSYNAKKDDTLRKAISGLLARLNAEPTKVLANLGKQTGKCCMCNKGLTDDASIHFGYGPVCAKNFGLPYSKNAATW